MGNKAIKPLPIKEKIEPRPEVNRFNILYNFLSKTPVVLIRIIDEYAEDFYVNYNPGCSMNWKQFKESSGITSSSSSDVTTVKLIIQGVERTGKTSLLNNLKGEKFDDRYIPTIGADFTHYSYVINKRRIKTALWDMAGNAQYRFLSYSYYRSSDGLLLVFNVYDHLSFEALPLFIKDYQQYGCDRPIMLIGHHIRGPISSNKIGEDMGSVLTGPGSRRVVSSEEAIEFGNKLNVPWMYWEVDAKISDENEEGNFKWPFLMFLSKVLPHRHDSYEVGH